MTLIADSPSEDLEGKIFHDKTIIATPIHEPSVRLVLYKQFDHNTNFVGYEIGLHRVLEEVPSHLKGKINEPFYTRRHMIEKVGTDINEAKKVFDTYCKALESDEAYLLLDPETGNLKVLFGI